MKSTLITSVAAGLLLWWAAECAAQQSPAMQNPAIQNPSVQGPGAVSPVGGATMPVSSYRDSLRATPNPLMPPAGNLVVTGNVSGGKFFRGVVPYNATSDLALGLGVSPVDNFLRDSAGSRGYGVYQGGIRPYYFERRTVTGFQPGTSQIYRPPTPKVSYGTPGGLLESSLDQAQVLAIPPMKVREVPMRPLSMTYKEWQETIAREIEKYPQHIPKEDLSEEEYEEQVSRLWEDLRDLTTKAEDLKQSLLIEEEAKKAQELAEQQRLKTVEETEEAKETEETREPDIYEQTERQAEEFKKMLEERRLKAEEEAKAKAEQEEATEREKRQGDEEERTDRPRRQEPSVIDSATRAKAILGEHKTLEAFAAARYREHMSTGDKLLKEGKYYRAADSYTLAVMYNPADAKAYAGKCYALFAAGEYMSSALFLARTIEASEAYLREKADIVAIVGDRDRIESRIADAQQWYQTSQAPELQFLLSYMYYRLGRMPEAKQAIGTAFEKMGDSAAVAALKRAIEGAQN